jgi:hypothetical protein
MRTAQALVVQALVVRALVVRVAAALTLTSCSALDPYPIFPADARPGEVDPGPRVAICYDTLVSTLDQVQAAAQQECVANTLAKPVRTDWYMQYCPLLLPARATFTCSPSN